jgi:hypothetical protein
MLIAMGGGLRRTVCERMGVSLLVGSNSGGDDRAVRVGRGGRSRQGLCVDSSIVLGGRIGFLARSSVALVGLGLCLVVGERHGSKRAATWSIADGGLGPALVLERNSSVVAEVLLELIAFGG